jgi:hypothetical protein
MGCFQSKYGKMLSKAERQIATEMMLQDNLPYNLLLVTNFFGIIMSLIMFALQILSIIYKSPFYYIGAG